MTIDELLKTLALEYPNGVSFEPMAVRLLRQKVALGDWQIDELKDEMFRLGDGLWFSSAMISDVEPQFAIRALASKWLLEYGCFSVERLFESYRGVIRHISTPEYFAAYMRHLKFTVTAWGKGGFICFQPPSDLDAHLAATSKTIAERLDEASGTLALDEIQEAMQHLTTEALDAIREKFLPEVHVAEVGGLPCWRSAEAIPLPEDFSEKLTTAVNTLVDLEERVNAANLTFALNVLYCFRFREEYALPDNDTFMRVCAKYYQGGHAVFPNTRRPRDPSSTGKRVRSPNTRFINLGVPIGAELVFTRDRQITCTVRDDSNQVEYDGKVWAISALANHLMDASAENGFDHFSYQGETLWVRRLRLERESNKDARQAEKIPPPAEVRVSKEACDLSVSGKRLRSPNTRFINLGVPIGAELIFKRDSQITCTVRDDSNQVEFDGKVWAISALANHLLDASAENGFDHFCYEGETLWGRRLRLEREGKQDENQEEKMSPPDEVREADNEIIGLEGHPLSSATWRAFRCAGTNPRVAEWVRRIEKGESVEKIARESGYSASTVKVQIGDRRRYFKVCESNKIMPEGSVHV